MKPENDSKPPQPVAEAESLVGVASTALFGGDGATGRGFPIVEFRDEYDHACSIQESSRAVCENDDGTVDDPLGWIWLGIDDPQPQIMKRDAQRLGMRLPPGEVTGWMPYPLPQEVHMTTRMHLNEAQVRGLIDRLTVWLETGSLTPNVKEHAPSPAGASVDSSETDQNTGESENKAAGDGCRASACSPPHFFLLEVLEMGSEEVVTWIQIGMKSELPSQELGWAVFGFMELMRDLQAKLAAAHPNSPLHCVRVTWPNGERRILPQYVHPPVELERSPH